MEIIYQAYYSKISHLLLNMMLLRRVPVLIRRILPYGDELIYYKSETVDEAYLEALDNYIVAEIILAVKYAIPFWIKSRTKKLDSINLPIGDAN